MQNSTILQSISPEDLQNLIASTVDEQITSILEKLSGKSASDQLLNRNDVCELLQIDLSTLYLWTKKGRIKASKIGSRVYYRRADVDAALIPVK